MRNNKKLLLIALSAHASTLHRHFTEAYRDDDLGIMILDSSPHVETRTYQSPLRKKPELPFYQQLKLHPHRPKP